MILGCSNSSVLLWVGCVLLILTLSDHYGILWVVCICLIYKLIICCLWLFVVYLWLFRYIGLEWARVNPCMARAGIKPGISCMIAGYLFHCSLRHHGFPILSLQKEMPTTSISTHQLLRKLFAVSPLTATHAGQSLSQHDFEVYTKTPVIWSLCYDI